MPEFIGVFIAHNHHEESIFQNPMEGNDHWGLVQLVRALPVTDCQPRINQASAVSADSTPLGNDHSLLHPHRLLHPKAVARALINKEAERAVGIRRPASVKVAPRQFRSVKPSGDTAHDYGAETAVWPTIRSGDVSVSRHFQNAELLGQETAIPLAYRVSGPLVDVGVPDWAVIGGSRGNATKRIVRPMPIQKRGAQTLTLRILAAAFCRPVRRDEDPLDGATLDVVHPGLDFAQTWSEGVPLDRRHSGIA
jgi:hypothetical protein